MTTFQIAALAIVAVLVLTNFVDVKALFAKFTSKKPSVQPTVVAGVPIGDVPRISEIVEQWDKLKQMCLSAGSKSSSEELNKVFLTLLDKEVVKSEKP